jgi:hypothetical protein
MNLAVTLKNLVCTDVDARKNQWKKLKKSKMSKRFILICVTSHLDYRINKIELLSAMTGSLSLDATCINRHINLHIFMC